MDDRQTLAAEERPARPCHAPITRNALFLPTLPPDPAQIKAGQCCVWFEPMPGYIPVLFMGRTPEGQLVAGSLPLCKVNEDEAQQAFDSGAATWLRRPPGSVERAVLKESDEL